MKVTAVIPAYNAASELPEQLAALAAQDRDREFEVVVADNGSTDATAAAARAFADRLDLRVIDASQRQGQPYALNEGIAAATGDALLILDADDVVAPGYVSAMARALEDHEFVAARLDCESLNEPWQVTSRPPTQLDGPGSPFGFLPVAVGCAIGVRAELVDRLGGFDETMSSCSDVDLSWRYALAGVEIHFVEDAVLQYRYRDTLRGVYRQARVYGSSGPLLFTRYGDRGMPRRSPRTALRFWGGVVPQLARTRTRADVATLAFLAGYRAGLARSAVHHRVWYL